MKDIKTLPFKFVLLFLVMNLITYLTIEQLSKRSIESYMSQTTQTYTQSFQTILNQYKKLSYIVSSGILFNTQIAQKLNDHKISQKSDLQTIKKEFIQKIDNRYKALHAQHIKSINVFLWDDTILVSMKNKKAFGKKLSQKRMLIQKAIKEKAFVQGYEIGSYGEGFRFIYPILSPHKEYLGTIELVFDPAAVTSSIMEQYYVLSNFFVKANKMSPKYEQNSKEYRPSHHNGFLYNVSVLEELKKVSRLDMKKLKPSTKTTTQLFDNFQKKEPLSYYDEQLGDIITSIPILHTISGEMDAVLTIRSKGDKLEQLVHYYNTLHILMFAFILVLCIALYTKRLKDITTQQSSQKIQELQERFELAMQASKDGIWDWNPITNSVYYSSTWKKMLGYEDDEIGNTLDEWKKRVHIDDLKKTLEDIEDHLNGKTNIYENIHRVRHKDGHWVWILDRGKAIYDENGKTHRMIGFHTDISKQKQLEQESLHKERRLFNQDKMVQMGEMIGNIAHQWRQPLSVIATLATGIKMKKEFNTLDDEYLLKGCDNINENAQYLSKTINTFRDFIKENKNKEEIILQKRIADILKILEASLKNSFIAFYDETQKTPEIKVSLVANELDQVIINIINNAKDAILAHEINDGWIKIALFQDDKSVTITIEDNGGGISKEALPRIFDPYFTTKHQSQGTGLGLHMSYKIIHESLQGELYAKNTDQGAKFFIKIPLA